MDLQVLVLDLPLLMDELESNPAAPEQEQEEEKVA
jgi:hypothetical protein